MKKIVKEMDVDQAGCRFDFFALCCPITVSAAEDFVVIAARVSPTMQPRVPNDADDVFRECPEECRTLAARSAWYLQRAPERLSAAMAIIRKAEMVGEDGIYSIKLPIGFRQVQTLRWDPHRL